MKKLVSFFTVFLFSTLIFASQPFFLQNWIIPEDAQWGQMYEIPPIEGITFDQGNEYAGFVYFMVESYNQSHADLPPYFVENKLAGWDMTYNQILKALKANNEFYIYEQTESDVDYYNEEDGLTYNDVIAVVPKNERSFTLFFDFGDLKNTKSKKTAKPLSFYINYNDITGIYDPLLYWDNNTDKEKSILALTAYNASTWNFVISEFDCTVRKASIYDSYLTGGDAKNLLTNFYGIKSKEELLEEVNRNTDWAGKEYEELKVLLIKYPDKKPYEIAETENKAIAAVPHMYCMKVIGDKLGSHGISSEHKLLSMFLCRLAAGAGLITHDEAVEIAWPIAQEILSWYSSYEDFGFHQILSTTYSGSGYNACSSYTDSAIYGYNRLRRLLPFDEIPFHGKKGSNSKLKIKELSYKPQSEEELYWYHLAGKTHLYTYLEDIPFIEDAINRYGELKILTNLFDNANPAKYDGVSSTADFFEENYREYWNQLPELEQYAIAFSSNLFELNKMFHLDFSNRISFLYARNYSKEILSDSWSVTDGESLIETFNSLEEYGHSGAYKMLSGLLDKYPDKNPFEIALLEELDILDISRLMYVRDTRQSTGPQGIEAWDQGREITILRWGIACGYITAEKAKELIAPVIQKIIQNYDSWTDFIEHYVIGRGFYYLYDYSYSNKRIEAITGDLSAHAYIPFDELKFTGKKTNEGASSLLDYKEGEDFIKWKDVQVLSEQQISQKQLEQLNKIEEEYKEYPNLFFWWKVVLLCNFGSDSELIDYIEAHYDYLCSLKPDSKAYMNSMYYYISALNGVFNPQKALQIRETLPEDLRMNAHFYYQYAYSNYLMMNLCNSQVEFETYKKRAIEALNVLLYYGYELSPAMDGWLQSVQ